jgi:hypothetical protein
MNKQLLVSILACALSQLAIAQDRPQPDRSSRESVPARNLRREESPMIATPSLTAATPEMWFYEQERVRQESPKYAVRHKAELRSAQRQERIAAMKWYGMSNSRPMANVTPLFSSYSPTWVSGAGDPLRWPARASTVYVVVRPHDDTAY